MPYSIGDKSLLLAPLDDIKTPYYGGTCGEACMAVDGGDLDSSNHMQIVFFRMNGSLPLRGYRCIAGKDTKKSVCSIYACPLKEDDCVLAERISEEDFKKEIGEIPTDI